MEPLKMARGTGLAPKLGQMGPNIMADGSMIRNMELESTDGPMGLFTKVVLKMAN
jgi:hypothetical protein